MFYTSTMMTMNRSVISRVRPHLKWINQARYMRPTVKIAQDRFVLTMDVKNFFKDELSIKARPDYVVIEGRQERKCKNGFVVRQFARKFKLPEGCTPSRMETKLSQDGILTFIAHRYAFEIPGPCERDLPISYSGPDEPNDGCVRCDPACMPHPCCLPASPCDPQCPPNAPPQFVHQSPPNSPENQEQCEVPIRVREESKCHSISTPPLTTPSPTTKPDGQK